jgi:hypothetical protein
MRFLADENVSRLVIERLRAGGFDVISIGETRSCAPDASAFRPNRPGLEFGKLDVSHQKGNVMTKLFAAMALATVVASSAFAQSYDPSIGSGNLTGNGSLGVYVRPRCEVRRVEFSDASGWRARDVRVCCTLGRCAYQLTY